MSSTLDDGPEGTGLPLAVSSWGDDELSEIARVVASGQFTMNSRVRTFESKYADYHAIEHACMVNSGSSANLVMLSAARFAPEGHIREGQEVIVPSVSWSTTYFPVNQVGAVLRFVDVDATTFNIDVDAVAQAINPNTAGILAVNLLGNPADLVALEALARDAGVVLLEDNCEALGASIDGRLTGTFGLASTCSFFFSHHISTMEGGAVLTRDRNFYEACLSLRAHGWLRDLPPENSISNLSGDPWEDLFRFVLPGYNLRPLEFEGAIGEVQLRKLPNFLQARRRNAQTFREYVRDIPGIQLQEEHGESSWFGFGIVLTEHLHGRRKEIVRALTEAGIQSRPIVAGNFVRNPVMKHLKAQVAQSLPVADQIHDQGFFIGNHHFDVSDALARAAEVLASAR